MTHRNKRGSTRCKPKYSTICNGETVTTLHEYLLIRGDPRASLPQRETTTIISHLQLHHHQNDQPQQQNQPSHNDRRGPADAPLPENGLGNAKYNSRDLEWDGYDYTYKITSVYELCQIIPLADMIMDYGFKSSSQGLVYLPRVLGESVDWREQRLVLTNDDDN